MGQSSFPRVYRDYVHFSLCAFSFLSVGTLLFGAQVINFIVWHDRLPRFRMEGMACYLITYTTVVFVTLFALLLCVGHRFDAKRPVSWSKLLDKSFCRQPSLTAKHSYENCADLLTGTKETLSQIKAIWVVMAAQVTCLAAGALEKGNGYYATSLCFIVLFAYFLGYGHYVNQRARRRVKKEMKAKRLSKECFPRVAEAIALARFNPDIVWLALVAPPFSLAFGFASAKFGFPTWIQILLVWFLGGVALGNLPFRCSVATFEKYSDS